MILPIYLYGQPVLRKPTEEVEQGSLDVKQLVADMQETLTAAEGCGLAAPQIGKSIRLFIVDGSELGEDYPECADFKQTFINPEILEESEETSTYSEGCLSLPGISENVVRPKTITIRYQDEDFRWHEARIDEVRKPGDVKLHGLALTLGDSGTAPVLYLEQFEQMYEEGVPQEKLLQSIADTYAKAVRTAPNISAPDMSFESLKDSLRVRLVYNRTNAEYLRDHVSVDTGLGYSLVVYADMSKDLFDGAIINMKNDMIDKFGLDEKAVIDAAIEGSMKNCPAVLTHIEAELFSKSMGQKPENLLETAEGHAYEGVLVLTTEDKFAGAAALLYPGVKERIAELMQGGYYILPSSIHEMLILADDGHHDPEELARMVSFVNANEVSPEEQLGNRVLFYNAEEKQMSVACDLDANRTREGAR